jgi:hypothetical protein
MRGHGAGTPQNCRGVERYEPPDVIGRLLDESSADGRAGVVDEDPDAGVVAQPGLYTCLTGSGGVIDGGAIGP